MPRRRDSDGLVCQRGLHPLEGRRTCRECERARERDRRRAAGMQPRETIQVARYDAAWMDEALCREYDPELWFKEFRKDYRDQVKARSVCRRCPVQRECFDLAMVNGEEYGIWGGFGPGFRRDLAKHRDARTKTGAVS